LRVREWLETIIIAFSMMLNGCCNMRYAQAELNKKLDMGDIHGALQQIDNPCIAKIPHIKTTKAVLMYRLSMDEKDIIEKARLKEGSIKLLRSEAAEGYSSAIDILDSYDRLGDAYFVTFPWGGLIGPSMPIGKARSYGY
jgi:hypothetical protein